MAKPVASVTWVRSLQCLVPRGVWFVLGPAGLSGEVRVHRKDGTSSKVMLSSAIWEHDGKALYRVDKAGKTPAPETA